MAKITRAILSVSDKTGIVELGQALRDAGVELLSTGGTARALREAGLEVKDVSEHTGFPEMMDGRVKTLHPKIHGGLLGRRGQDEAEMESQGILPIDMVVVNLYPFEQTIARPDVTFEDAIENIDIGGPTMLRSAAKNHRDVTVIVDPEDYAVVMAELREKGGAMSVETNTMLARKVFAHTSRYDTIIARYLREQGGDDAMFPETLTTTYTLEKELRYGENPHQRAAAYVERSGELNILEAEQVQGRIMSFNNYDDVNTALMVVREFDSDACAIVKHGNPCGVGLGANPAEAYMKAFNADHISAYGSSIAFNCPVDGEAAEKIIEKFVEVVLAPEFSPEAISVFGQKPDIRLIKLPGIRQAPGGLNSLCVAGGLLLQEWDLKDVDIHSLKAATKRAPTPAELDALSFAWKVVRHVKSNAIVYAHADRTVGIGTGQTSRIASIRVGAINAEGSLTGTVLASDGFFPLPDGIQNIARMGVTAIIQPGGALRDREIIELADDLDVAMLFTGDRHFRH